MKHMKEMPSLQACDVFPRGRTQRGRATTRTRTAASSRMGSIWYTALKKWMPNTIEKYESESKAAPESIGRVKKAKAETTQPKRKAKAKAVPPPSGAASSGEQSK